MIYIQEFNWDQIDNDFLLDDNLIKYNPYLYELITKQDEIFSNRSDIKFRLAEEQKTKIIPLKKNIDFNINNQSNINVQQ